MKRILGFICLICLLATAKVYAQDHYVQGRVSNVTDGGAPFRVGTVKMFFAETRKEAETIVKNLKKDHHYYDVRVKDVMIIVPDENGYYVCEEAYEFGYIVVDVGTKVIQMYPIAGLSDLNIEIAVEGEKLDEVYVEAKLPDAPSLPPTAPTVIGNVMFFEPQFAALGDEDDRIIFQPYVTSCFLEQDTVVEFLNPVILQGAEFELTQDRRMGYDITRDPIQKFVVDTLIASNGDTITGLKDNKYFKFSRSYRFEMPDPSAYYQVRFSKVTQEYPGVTESFDTIVCKCQREDPLQYFQYDFETYSYGLDPLKYRPSSQLRARNDADTVSLTFLVGRTQLDPNNPKNETEWEKIVNRLNEILEMKGSKIQSYEIVGVASPEGGYQMNQDLAQRRANYAINRLTEQGLLKKSMPTSSKGEVAGWDQVAALLDAGHPEKATAVREIIAKHSTIDAQSSIIRKLPYYGLIKDSILPQLRVVRTSCKYVVRRNLHAHEILEIYRTDPSFRFEPTEYWSLIQSIKDPAEKIEICKRALRENRFDTPLRPFAANEMARAEMSLNVVDTTTLKEFIFDQYRVNQPQKITDTYTKIYNPDAIIGNQVCMLLEARHFFDAASLVRRINDLPEYRELSQLVACLNGYYAEDPAVLNANLGKDIINTVVLHLAMGAKQNKDKVSREQQRYHNFQAMKYIRQLNDVPAEKKALAYYLKAVIYNRIGYLLVDVPEIQFYSYLFEQKPVDCLVKCFELDESFIQRCQGDAYIRDKYDDADPNDRDIFDEACDRYFKWKNGDAELGYTVLDDMEHNFMSCPDPTPENLKEWGLIKE